MVGIGSGGARYHFLLVGVDGYPGVQLRGCVNDVDAVQQLVLDAHMVDEHRIRRLVSPLPDRGYHTSLPEQPATLANIRAALAELASDQVAPDDRVFILLSGHGLGFDVLTGDGRRFRREAFIPVDYACVAGPPQVLYDFELNERLRRIVQRTRSVTLMLDCCRTGGAQLNWTARRLDLGEALQRWTPPADLEDGDRGIDAGDHRLGARVNDCQVVSSCMNHEQAKEAVFEGTCHGLFTWALVTQLRAATDVDLRTVTWARIWQAVRAEVELRNPSQHIWMQGNALRAVFGGPPVEGDAGIPVRWAGDGYRIEAGTLASISPGAELAVYGERPAWFPPLDSDAARQDMLGTLRVTRAERAFAIAEANRPFELPRGARARLINAAPGTRLRCGVRPADRWLEDQIRQSPLLELVPAGETATVWLEQFDGRWALTDELHGPGADRPALHALAPDDVISAREMLEHYREYAWPIRVAQRATDLPGALELRVLACGWHPIAASEAQAIDLPEAPTCDGKYRLTPGARFCFHVGNRSIHELRVTLFLCCATGTVMTIGEQVLGPRASARFWAHGDPGRPFQVPPGDLPRLDCVVAIGRTARATDLDFLRVDRTFAQAGHRYRGVRNIGIDDQSDQRDLWTAALVVIHAHG